MDEQGRPQTSFCIVKEGMLSVWTDTQKQQQQQQRESVRNANEESDFSDSFKKFSRPRPPSPPVPVRQIRADCASPDKSEAATATFLEFSYKPEAAELPPPSIPVTTATSPATSFSSKSSGEHLKYDPLAAAKAYLRQTTPQADGCIIRDASPSTTKPKLNVPHTNNLDALLSASATATKPRSLISVPSQPSERNPTAREGGATVRAREKETSVFNLDNFLKDTQPRAPSAAAPAVRTLEHKTKDSLSENEANFGELTVGDTYGAAALTTGAPRQTTVTALTEVVMLVLDMDEFYRLLRQISHVVRLEGQRWKWFISNKAMRGMRLEDVALGYTLGEGTFGRVKLVIHTASSTAYVLKCIRKAGIVMYEQEEHIASERRLLASLNHPFINKLSASFQDEWELYMMLEPLMGGELTRFVTGGNFISEPATRFYAACVVSALTYLHDLKVAYRDLKPENLVMDSDGYLKMVDFGFAKVVEDRTYTFCGTPEFIAPEIVTNSGHSMSADWWAMGILVYNMLTGTTPFLPEDDQLEAFALVHAIYRRSMRRDGFSLQFPLHVLPPSRDLISELLIVEPSQRLGSRDPEAVKRHSFFGSFGCGYLIQPTDFNALENRRLEPPYTPPPQSEGFVPEPIGVQENFRFLNGLPMEEKEILRGKTFPDF